MPESVKKKSSIVKNCKEAETKKTCSSSSSLSRNETSEVDASGYGQPSSFFNFVHKTELSTQRNSFFGSGSDATADSQWNSYYGTDVDEYPAEDASILETDSALNEAASCSGSSAIASATTTHSLDAQVLQRLQGRRKNENVEIRDVNAHDQLEDVSIQLTKALSEEPEHPGGFAAAKGDGNEKRAKSKHQLNWLVSHAKAQEVALKNQWAQNRMNRRATQMKYGF